MPKITSVTISAAPKVWTDKYHAFNPHASVTFVPEEGKDVQAEVEAVLPVLRGQLARALYAELLFLAEVQEAVPDNNPTKFIQWCEGQIDAAGIKATAKVDYATPGVEDPAPSLPKKPPAATPAKKPPVPVKAPALKAAAKALFARGVAIQK